MCGCRLLGLAGQGLPCADEDGRDLSRYRHRLEATKWWRVPQAGVTSHQGWQEKNGEEAFVWGCHTILPSGEMPAPLDLDQLAPELWLPDRIAFRASSEGDRHLAAACHASGSFEAWRRAVL